MQNFVDGFIFYSWFFNRKYSVERRTNNLKVPYFVKENFHIEYQGSLTRLDASVEEEYLTNLKHACYRERNYSKYTINNANVNASYVGIFLIVFLLFCIPTEDSMIHKARAYGGREMMKQASLLETPSCDLYQTLLGRWRKECASKLMLENPAWDDDFMAHEIRRLCHRKLI